jgi:hypothetical protein
MPFLLFLFYGFTYTHPCAMAEGQRNEGVESLL